MNAKNPCSVIIVAIMTALKKLKNSFINTSPGKSQREIENPLFGMLYTFFQKILPISSCFYRIYNEIMPLLRKENKKE
jgi:hypothetical protein